MKKRVRGSFTIEAAMLVPLLLLVFSVLMNMLFYCHDKVVFMSLAHETLALGCAREGMDKEELEHYFSARVKKRLLLFTQVEQEIQWGEEEIKVVCKAKKKAMSMEVEYGMKRTAPEDYVRSVRKIIKMQEGIGKES